MISSAILCLWGMLAAQAVDPNTKRIPVFESFRQEQSGLHQPADMAVTRDGEVLVLEAGAHRVRRFGPDGTELQGFGERGSRPGELLRPGGMTVDLRGQIWIADTGNDRVQVFGSAGKLIAVYGSRGTRHGQFESPAGMDSFRGLIAVADLGNRRVLVLSVNGEFQRELLHKDLRRPVDVAFADDGTLFVADADAHRIFVFDSLGRSLTSFGSWGGYDGQLDTPSGVDFHAGHLYVADRGNHRVQIFTPEGKHVGGWGLHAILPREGRGKLHYPERVVIHAGSERALVLEPFEDRLQIFGERSEEDEDAVLRPLGPPSKGGIAHFGWYGTTGGDLVFLLEPETHGFLAFDLDAAPPALRTTAGGFGQANGRFVRPSGLALTADGKRLVVGDAGNRRLQEFRIRHDPEDEIRFVRGEARFARSIQLEHFQRKFAGRELLWHPEPGDMALAPDGRLWVIDRRNDCLLVFDERLRPFAVFGGHGAGAGQFLDPLGIAFTPSGDEIFVVDGDQRAIQVFGLDGKFRRRVAALPSDVQRPFALAFTGEDSLWVSDAGAECVLRLDLTSGKAHPLGGPGLGRSQFHRPAGILRQPDGTLLVIDHGNHRVQRFRPDGEFIDTFGARWFVREAR